jgi:hypothetical protein
MPDDERRYEPIKYVLVFNHDAVGPVTVSIPEPDRDSSASCMTLHSRTRIQCGREPTTR